jgi:hypothetical protein
MGRKNTLGTAGKVVASVTAGSCAAFVGSEMLQQLAKTKEDRALFALTCLTAFCGLWACWEVLQVREHLGLIEGISEDD